MADASQRARQVACRLLSRRPYTVLRLRTLLLGKRFDARCVDAVLEDLTSAGLLDDAAFAAAHVTTHEAERGARRIAADLRKQGIGGADLEAALAGLPPPEETARALLERCSGRFAGLEPHVAQRRAAAFLQRRGFESGAVYRAVRDVLGDPDD